MRKEPAVPPISIDKNQNRIGAMFNRIAPTYDFLNHFLSVGLDVWWRWQAVKSLNLRTGERILDVATGTGDLAFTALTLEEDLHLVGVDLASLMLKEAQRKRVRRRIRAETYSLITGDALHLPLKKERFDAAMIAYGVRNVPDMKRAFHEFCRVLRTDGQLLILEFSLPSTPVFRSLYLFYFEKILPCLGGLISRDKEAYDYLPASVGAFSTSSEISDLLLECGFKTEETRLLFGGVTYYLRARKSKGR
jgi:demethylmenaquinone methyltransferase/2-methoxy-6-polyprenyl-1,4-benzoquinol methylase